MIEMPPLVQATLALLVLTAAVVDVRTRRIPNWLTAAGLLAGFGLQAFYRGWQGLKDAGLGALVGFGVYFVLFALRAMGAGDVKLMAAAGALAGASNWLVIFILASILGGVIALVLVVLRGTLLRTVRNVWFAMGHLIRLNPPYRANPELDVAHPAAVTLPHGLSIALGCLIFLVLLNFQP